MSSRFALVMGLVFAVIGLVYWFVQQYAPATKDIEGASLLVILGIAMAFGFSVLIRGSRDL